MLQSGLSALIELLVCPACHAKVELDPSGTRLRCQGCSREYPIDDGIPVMIESRALGPQAAP